MEKANRKRKKIVFFGHFGKGNLGNESTLQAMLYNLRKKLPDAEVTCICTGPEATATTHNIVALPISTIIVKSWPLRNPLAVLARKVLVGIPTELYRWLKAVLALKSTDMFIVPGTGLLTDACGLLAWGPYNMFKWSLVAKLSRSKVVFLSVGAGPIYSALGRWFVKSALLLADFRSYRDATSMQYLEGIGFRTNSDRIYPDLAFSLPATVTQGGIIQRRHRRVVGVGLMTYAGRYSVANPVRTTYSVYLEELVTFVKWLLAHNYDTRLLVTEVDEEPLKQEFKDLLEERASVHEAGRIIDEPTLSVDTLLVQLASTDVVVATRFHNILLALILNKPVISISFHHKCTSLMSAMGLSEYCQDIHRLDADKLIDQFSSLENNVENLTPLIKQKIEEFRKALDEQYNSVFKGM